MKHNHNKGLDMRVSVGQINYCDLFAYNGDLYMRVKVSGNDWALNMSTGYASTLSHSLRVEPVQHEPLVWSIKKSN